uniref:Peptidase S1 domain-containing protein n=1 Tax=Romanomermis culicivorax TaxID=13658 RepID=A0A915J981_ROMCU
MHIPLNVLYYCLQVYMASSILHVTKLSFNNGNEPCKVRMLYGFHIRDIYARINEVYVYDCVMICKLLEQCLSASYVSTSRSSTACFLSKTVSTNIQALYRLPGSFYFEFTCSNGEKTKRLPTALDHGPKYSGCGVKAFKSIGQTRFNRIVGGTFAPPYSQPWLGQVMKHSWNLCGISLVSGIKTDSTVWAISAAHCFKRRYDFDHSINLESYNFIFGVHDLRYHSPHMKLRKAEQIILHPDYDFETNDLAIIKFEKPIPFNDYVRPLCMAWKKLRTYKGPCMPLFIVANVRINSAQCRALRRFSNQRANNADHILTALFGTGQRATGITLVYKRIVSIYVLIRGSKLTARIPPVPNASVLNARISIGLMGFKPTNERQPDDELILPAGKQSGLI